VINMRISILPTSSLGKWSVGLAVAWIQFFVASEVLIGFDVFGPVYNRALALILIVVIAAIGGVALVIGIASIIKSKERSIFVFVTTALSFYGLFGTVLSILSSSK
jgi:hypothetical protein